MFSKKATKIDEIFTVDLTLCNNVSSAENLTKRSSVLLLHLVRFSVEHTLCVKSTVKISSIFVAFLENTN